MKLTELSETEIQKFREMNLKRLGEINQVLLTWIEWTTLAATLPNLSPVQKQSIQQLSSLILRLTLTLMQAARSQQMLLALDSTDQVQEANLQSQSTL